MTRRESSYNTSWRFVPPLDYMRIGAGLLMAGGALTWTSAGGNWEAASDGDGNGRDSQSYIADLPPDERFQHDFNGFDSSGDNCLGGTGYDLYDHGHNQIVKVGSLSMDGDVIVITPGEPNKYGDELRLKSDSGLPGAGTRPLQPDNSLSEDILRLHDCNFTNY